MIEYWTYSISNRAAPPAQYHFLQILKQSAENAKSLDASERLLHLADFKTSLNFPPNLETSNTVRSLRFGYFNVYDNIICERSMFLIVYCMYLIDIDMLLIFHFKDAILKIHQFNFHTHVFDDTVTNCQFPISKHPSRLGVRGAPHPSEPASTSDFTISPTFVTLSKSS